MRGQRGYSEAKQGLQDLVRYRCKAGLFILPTAQNGERLVGVPLGWRVAGEEFFNDLSALMLVRGHAEIRDQYLHELEPHFPKVRNNYLICELHPRRRAQGIWGKGMQRPSEYKFSRR